MCQVCSAGVSIFQNYAGISITCENPLKAFCLQGPLLSTTIFKGLMTFPDDHDLRSFFLTLTLCPTLLIMAFSHLNCHLPQWQHKKVNVSLEKWLLIINSKNKLWMKGSFQRLLWDWICTKFERRFEISRNVGLPS